MSTMQKRVFMLDLLMKETGRHTFSSFLLRLAHNFLGFPVALHPGLVVRRVQAEQPARLVSRLGGRSGAIPDRIGQPFELHRIGHVPRPRIRRIEHVLVELRLRDGQPFHHRAEAILAVVGQRHAGEPEIAQVAAHLRAYLNEHYGVVVKNW